MKVVVIGSGPGGYVAAIRCAQLGMDVSIIEKYAVLGGTCLNVGCIPSKALLDSSEHFYFMKHHAEVHGISANGLQANLKQMQVRKRDVVLQNNKGIEFLMKKNKIKVVHGKASFETPSSVAVVDDRGAKVSHNFDRCIIATGSKPSTPKAFNYDKKRIITSTEALELSAIPKHMVIIGAGVIGLELGSVFARLGTQVEVVEYLDRILPGMDHDCAKELQKTLLNLGLRFHLEHTVKEVVPVKDKSVKVTLAPNAGGSEFTIDSDYCLIAVGRRAYTEGLQLENAGISLDAQGRIKTNANLQTDAGNIYAIGDVTAGPMLAHKAEEEGIFVAEHLAGQKPHIRYDLIPSVVYTWPELAGVGMTEDQLKQLNRNYTVGSFPFKALGRARASGEIDGLVKILADPDTDEILGVHITGPRASDLIMEAAVAMEFKASAEDLARICHPHPTFSEAIKEAAWVAYNKRAIHL